MRTLSFRFLWPALFLAAAFSACDKEESDPAAIKVGSYYDNATATPTALKAIVRGGATATTTPDLGLDSMAWAFDGTDDYLEVPDAADFKTKAVSVAAWVKNVENKKSNGLFFKSNGQESYDEAYGLFINADGAFVGVAARDKIEPVATSGSYALDKWHHVAITASEDSVILYVNGSRADAKATGFELKHAETPLLIGHYPYAMSYFKGTLADLRVYGVALTAAQVAEIGPK